MKYICPLFWLFLLLPFQTPLQAQNSVHYSAMMNSELVNGYGLGVDSTLLINQTWGLRYTLIPEVKFLPETVERFPTELTTTRIDGDFKSFMFLKPIDYRTFSGTNKGPFDFLTAYWGLGYNKVNLKVSQIKFRVQSNKLVAEHLTETVESPLYSFAFGFYGGEKFVVIDTRLLYIQGHIPASNLLQEKTKISLWMLLMGLGIGF